MYKLFSPKEYGFIGFFLGLPTVLSASFRNGGELKTGHPQILRTAQIFLGLFFILLAGMIVLDTFNLLQIQNSGNRYVGTQQIARFTVNFNYISWGFLLIQLILLVAFIVKSNKLEVPIYNELKQTGQVTARSNVSLFLIGVFSWVLFWGYGFCVRVLADYLAFGSILG